MKIQVSDCHIFRVTFGAVISSDLCAELTGIFLPIKGGTGVALFWNEREKDDLPT